MRSLSPRLITVTPGAERRAGGWIPASGVLGVVLSACLVISLAVGRLGSATAWSVQRERVDSGLDLLVDSALSSAWARLARELNQDGDALARALRRTGPLGAWSATFARADLDGLAAELAALADPSYSCSAVALRVVEDRPFPGARSPLDRLCRIEASVRASHQGTGRDREVRARRWVRVTPLGVPPELARAAFWLTDPRPWVDVAELRADLELLQSVPSAGRTTGPRLFGDDDRSLLDQLRAQDAAPVVLASRVAVVDLEYLDRLQEAHRLSGQLRAKIAGLTGAPSADVAADLESLARRIATCRGDFFGRFEILTGRRAQAAAQAVDAFRVHAPWTGWTLFNAVDASDFLARFAPDDVRPAGSVHLADARELPGQPFLRAYRGCTLWSLDSGIALEDVLPADPAHDALTVTSAGPVRLGGQVVADVVAASDIALSEGGHLWGTLALARLDRLPSRFRVELRAGSARSGAEARAFLMPTGELSAAR